MRLRQNLGFLVVLTVCTVRPSGPTCRGQETEDAKKAVPDRVQVLMQDRNYDEAIAAIDAAIAAEEGPADYLLYLKGRAFHFQREYDDAAITFDRLLEAHAQSDWARRARFAKAAAFTRKGDFRAAELIYRDEAEYLLSEGRKQELAAIFLDFAEAYFKPEGVTKKPDFEQARKFYEKALEMGPEPKLAAEVKLKIGQCWQEQGNFGEAAARYQQFVQEYGTSRENGQIRHSFEGSMAAELEIADALVEARYRLGWSQLQLGQLAEARRTWQDLLDDVDLTENVADKSSVDLNPRHGEAGERLAEAMFHLAKTYGVPTPGSSEDLDLGIAALERFIEQYSTHKLASAAHLQIAQSLMHVGRFAEATARLRSFLGQQGYEGRDEVAEARYLLGHCLLQQREFANAMDAWRDYLSKHPSHGHWTDAQQQIIQAEFLAAAHEREEKHYDNARELWLAFLAKYPLDPRAAEILFTFGEMRFEQDQWQEAIDEWRNVVSKYPGSDTASKAQYRIALTLETKLAKLEEALAEYRKLDWGNHANSARQRIAELTAKQLAIQTERIFRSDETPRIKLNSRNIEEVTVKIYAVDLETYFRKMHLARGVEGLDIALIDPDETLAFKVPEYQELKPIESQIEITWPQNVAEAASFGNAAGEIGGTDQSNGEGGSSGNANGEGGSSDNANGEAGSSDNANGEAGSSGSANGEAGSSGSANGEAGSSAHAWAVTVSSKTLEATTLVLQSDLDVIVKSSRDEIFVFAENMRTGKAWPDARLLISDGSKVYAEATTGDDGVLQASYEELKSAGDVRVFAVAEGHYASNVIDLGGLGVSEGLADKGYIYTDRPAYRSGQMVHVRGVIRRVDGDRYQVDENKPFHVNVFDPRGRQLWAGDVALSRFGSFHAHFLLPGDSPQGEYRIDVREPSASGGNRNYQGAFLVHEYKLEPIHLVVDTERQVFYRGETIEGTIRAEFYYGAPLASSEIRYQLAGGDWRTATTDDKGEVKFEFETREFRETQPLPLVVALPERNLATQSVFILATRGFSIGLETTRDVFLAKETFETTITTTDAEGQPTAQELEVKLIEQTVVDGKTGERIVETKKVSTGEKDGTARVVFTANDGGTYIVRAGGTDRFENPITADHTLQISDDDDTVRLRILAEQHTFKVGDDAKIRVHWREEPALALVTYQGARVLGYQLFELKNGENEIPIAMGTDLAPNFDLWIGVMTDRSRLAPRDDVPLAEREVYRRFHEATTPLTVIREMNVQVAIQGDKESFEPGTDVEVEITTTDPQGKPLAAELSLAMIEQALLDRYPSQAAAIDEFFRGQRRESAVRTTASVTFAYDPNTRPVDQSLLAERDRLEIAEEESRRMAELGDYARSFDAEAAGGRAGAVDGAVALGGVHFSEGAPVPSAAAPEQLDRQWAASDDARQAGIAGAGFGAGYGGRGYGPDENSRLGVMGGMAANRPGSATRFDLQDQMSGLKQEMQVDFGYLQDQAAGERVLELRGRYAQTESDFTGNQLYSSAGGVALPQERKAIVEFFEKNVMPDDAPIVYAGQHDWYALSLSKEAVVMQGNGQWNFVNFSDFDGDKANAIADELAGTGARMLSGLHSPETAFWNPVIATDENGKATITITLPERSTAWRLTARGITTETLAGEGTAKVAAKKDLFGELKLPPAVVDGDKARVVATIHNDAFEEGEITVTLKTKIGTWEREQTQTIQVDGKGLKDVVFEQTIDRSPAQQDARTERPTSGPEVQAAFELVVSAGDRRDTASRLVTVLPYGLDVFSSKSGAADADTTAWIELPAGMPVEAPSMQITVAPDVTRSLLDVVLTPPPIWCGTGRIVINSGLETTSSDLLASLALMELLQETQKSGGPEALALADRIRSSIGSLVSAQRDDGGWTWTGGANNNANPDPYVSARILWALAAAREAGYAVPDDSYSKATSYVKSALAQSATDDYETRAVLVHALATAGQGDFDQANRLFRERQNLSAVGLAYAALAFAAMDRNDFAAQLLDIIAQRNLINTDEQQDARAARLSWNQTKTEVRALYALALAFVDPTRQEATEQVQWLLAHRRGHRWSPDKATGPATMAAAKWLARNAFEAHAYKLTIFINNNQAAELTIEDNSLTQTVDVPSELLNFAQGQSRQTIRFQIEGRGRYSYQVAFGGFVPADKVQATTRNFRVSRIYEPAPIEIDGRAVPRGFGIVQGDYQSFRNPLTQLPVGKRGQVTLTVWRDNTPSSTPEHELPYLVVTEPIPAGTSVAPDSVSGAFERFEIGPGAITFYLGNRRYLGNIQYELVGYVPGDYRTAPTVLRDAYDPGQLAVSETKSLAVLPFGEKSGDEYRLSPQELFEIGKRHYDRSDMAAAAEHLGQLLADWNVQADPYKESVRMLLDAHLEIGPANKVVQYFEIMKEKWPELEISFDKILKIGAAYHEMGEYERSYMVFRATVESRFMTEVRVAGFLQGENEFAKSVGVMGQILAEYPPESYVAAAQYALTQQVYLKAADAATDPKLREAHVTRVDLVRQAIDMLTAFLTQFPEDPAADQASFSLASALLELEQHKAVIAACERFMERFPTSDLFDSFLYTIGFCHYALGDHEEALATCRRVAEMERTNEQSGRTEESGEKWRAIYILGQIYHSLGEAAEAIVEYTRVADRFPDAKQAIDYFTRRSLKLPEVTTLKPNEGKQVQLDFRNVAAADLKVYRIDLMKFSLLKRNLENIRSINLSGIRPLHEATIELGDGKDYRDREREIELPIEEEGAYLVVCRGEDLYTSGLVLVSPLVVQVQEDAASGRVRATVKDAVEDEFLADVHVKVIGSGNDAFQSGATDLRGVFIADGITGTTTVIAQREDDRYAFHRGEEYLGQQPPAANEPQAQSAAPAEDKDMAPANEAGKKVLLEGIEGMNYRIQAEGQQTLEQFYGNSVQGVQVEKAR